MPPVYGDSFGNLQQNIQADSNTNAARMQSALTNALQALQASQQREMVKDQFAARLKFERDQLAEHFKFLEQSRLDKQAQFKAEGPLRQAQVDLINKQVNEPSPAQARSDALRYGVAAEAARGGEDVSDIIPDKTDAALFGKLSKSARSGIEANYNRAAGLAAALTRADMLQERVDNATKAASDIRENRHFYNPFSWDYGNHAEEADKDALAAKAQLDALNKRLNPLKQDKRLMELVTPDPKTGRWMPAVAAPPSAGGTIDLPTSGVQNRRSYGAGAAGGRRPNFTPAESGVDMTVRDPEAAPMITNRPAITLPSGEQATVRTIGVGDERGEWVIPTIVDRKLVSNEEAIRLWKAGKNPAVGGPFKTPAEGNAFGQRLHESEAARIGAPATNARTKWVVNRARELTGQGMSAAEAVAQAKVEYEQ